MSTAKIIFLILCLLIIDNAYCIDINQAKIIHPNQPVRSLVLNQWTAEDGLISNNLSSVNIDYQGFIWITCYNGTIKFDGKSFELHDSEDLEFLHSNAFLDMFLGSDSTVWFSTQASGIVQYRNWHFSYPEFNRELPKNVKVVFEDRNHILWIGTNNSGLYFVQDNKLNKVHNSWLEESTIMDINADTEGNLYIATFNEGLIKKEGELYTKFDTDDGMSSSDVNCIYIDSNNTLYAGTTNGLNIIKEDRVITDNYFENVEINNIIEDGFGSIWYATETGLARTNDFYNIQEFFTTHDGLPTRQVSDLIFDFEGNLWLTTKKGGLIRLKYGNFVKYTETDGLALNLVNIIEEKEPGTYYVGSDDGAVNIIKNKTIFDFPINTDLNSNGVRDICFVDKDEVWIGSYSGILIKKGAEERLLNTENILPVNDVRRIRKDSRGNIWVPTRSGGLLKFEDKMLSGEYTKENGLGSDYVLCIQEDKQKNIWVGTHGGGLSKIDPDGQISSYNIYEDPSGILIFNIYEGEDDLLWLATNVGIFTFDGKTFKEIILNSTHQNDTFFDIIFDDVGGVWFTSNIGLYRVNRSDLEAFLYGEAGDVRTTVFDHNDGLENKECTGATRSLKGSDGKIWIPTLGGVATIDPANIAKNRIEPPVYITDFLTDRSGEFISEDLMSGNLVLEPGNFRYRIKYTALSYQAPDKVRFKYRLDKTDKDWTETVNVREVQYTNLPPGKYTFQVIASNNDNIWNEEGASFSFRIKPFIYQRVEVYVIGIALLLLLGWFGYRTRVNVIERRNKELKKVNEELDKFVYSASHDLKAPLNSVLGLVNIAKKDGPTGNMPLYLQMIEKSIKKLERFISDIIDYSRNASVSVKINRVEFNKIVEEAVEEIKYLDEENRIRKEIQIEGKGDFHSDERRISVVINNLLSNAVKYHDPSKEDQYVSIKIGFNSKEAEIIIEDNGMGISREHINKIFDMFYRATDENKGSGLGLYIVKETLDKLNGKIRVGSEKNKGTIFTLKLPSLSSA